MLRAAFCWIAIFVFAVPASAQFTVRAAPAGNSLLPAPSLGLLEVQAEASGDALPTAGSGSNKRYVLPVLLSAIVPGTGEIATGHWWRGIPFVAADIATWVLHAHYHTEGEDWRTAYKAYADAHWHYDTWQVNLQQYYNGPDPSYDFWDETQPDNCTCPYIPKEEDQQHYYENIGKYIYYYPGWDDWEWNGDPATSDSQAHRAVYYGMRQESNANFDRATDMLYVAMATRLASMTQVVFLMRKETRNLEVRPIRTAGRGTGLAIAYRY